MISSSCWYRFTYLSVCLPSCLCRVRSAHTAQPAARKTTANAVHLLLPTHAQGNVLELFFINPTLECNFNRWYCYESHPKGRMTKKTMNKLKNHLRLKVEDDKITSLNLSWFGGEPLMYFYEIVYPLTKFAKKLCKNNNIPFVSNVTTNGYYIDEEMIKKINEIGLYGFQITLDGHRKKHNKVRNANGKPSYDKIIENINLL